MGTIQFPVQWVLGACPPGQSGWDVKLVLSYNGTAQCTFMACTDSFMLCFEVASVWRNTFIQTSGHSEACSRTGVARNCYHHNTFVLTDSLANFKNFLH